MWVARCLTAADLPSPLQRSFIDFRPESAERGTPGCESAASTATRRPEPTRRLPLIRTETRGASESTNTDALAAVLVRPARLTAVTCQVGRPCESATGERT